MRKILKKFILNVLNDFLNEQNSTNNIIGYSPIEKIRNTLYPWIAVPFSGSNVFCQLRCPNSTQIENCGNITNIIGEKRQGNGKDKLEHDEIIAIKNYQEAICKIVFNRPTFDELFNYVGIEDFVLPKMKIELAEIEKLYEENKDKISETDKADIDGRIKKLEDDLGFLLPDDTMSFITNWAMGNDITDIKKINKDTFLKAAALAQANHKAPSDYISGVFTDFNRVEIDAYALSIYNEYLKDQKTVSEIKHNWIFGGRKRSKDTDILPKK